MPLDGGVAKKMMEKWGWNKGQGLGKKGTGMTSCLVLRKRDGSSTQGRIEMSTPDKPDLVGLGCDPGASSVPEPGAVAETTHVSSVAILTTDAPVVSDVNAAMTLGSEGAADSTAKRRRTKWEEDAAGSALQQPSAEFFAELGAAGAIAREVSAMDAQLSETASAQQAPMYDIDPRDADAAMHAAANAELQAQVEVALAMAGGSRPRLPLDPSTAQAWGETSGIGLKLPKQRVRIRQYVRDDWRWSKGTEALRYFEEVTLAKSLLDLARKVLGPGSRYPARIADDTDCVTEVTAWGTLIVRPRGTGANVALAKRMLYEVLHPSGEGLREDCIITPDEMAEAAVRDLSTIAQGEEADLSEKLKTGAKRNAQGNLRHVGLGAEKEAMEERASEVKSESREVDLATDEDARLVQRHIGDLRLSSGAIPVLSGKVLKLLGKDKCVRKATALVKALVDTGEWIGLNDGFVMSEETREKRKASEGPSEQILIKIADGPLVQRIEKLIKAMEHAALAEALKLTTKAVGGKRTLMVDGTKAAQERVKLMVKELAEKGESAMLTKALTALRSAIGGAAQTEVALSHHAGPGVIAADPVLVKVEPAVKVEPREVKVEPDPPKGLGGPAMRYLPKPLLIPVKTEELEALPECPALAVGGPEAQTAGAVATSVEAIFPPLPPDPSASVAGPGEEPGAIVIGEDLPGITE